MELSKMNYQKLALEKMMLEVAERASVPDYVSTNLKLEQVYDEISRQMIYKLKTFIWTRKIKNESIFSSEDVPVDWFQHFKERFFPKYLLKRYPVKYRTIATVRNYNVYHTCPHINYPADDREHMEFLSGKLSFENEFMENIEQQRGEDYASRYGSRRY